MIIYRSRAPLRVSFAGGGTDMPDWAKKYGGQIISTAIDKYVYVSAQPNNTKDVIVHAYDLNSTSKFMITDLVYNGDSDLIKVVLKHFKIQEGWEIFIHSDMPAGSGMGTSSSLIVALIAVFARVTHQNMNKYAIAELAFKLEREDLKQAGGYQDQYAAAFGGFNFMTFTDRVTVFPLKFSFEYLQEFNYRLILCYTGKTHFSSDIQKSLLANLQKMDKQASMLALKDYAQQFRDVMAQDNLAEMDKLGEILHKAWIAKKATNDKVTTDTIENLYLHSLQEGAVGGKILGAGGGGCLLLLAKPTERINLIHKLQQLGGEIIPFTFESEGVISWETK